jgi:hypothetical protein
VFLATSIRDCSCRSSNRSKSRGWSRVTHEFLDRVAPARFARPAQARRTSSRSTTAKHGSSPSTRTRARGALDSMTAGHERAHQERRARCVHVHEGHACSLRRRIRSIPCSIPLAPATRFAGGFIWLSRIDGRPDERSMRRAVVVGSAMGSFAVEKFSNTDSWKSRRRTSTRECGIPSTRGVDPTSYHDHAERHTTGLPLGRRRHRRGG